ncbi:carbamate kinase [Streptomyces massasporeus]
MLGSLVALGLLRASLSKTGPMPPADVVVRAGTERVLHGTSGTPGVRALFETSSTDRQGRGTAMSIDLRGHSYLSELDFTAPEISRLPDLSADFKAARRPGTERPCLTGRDLALREDLHRYPLREDLTPALLAEELQADLLLIHTDVPNVYAGSGTPPQRAVLDVTPAQLRDRTFPEGAIQPETETEATVRFVERTDGLAAIGAPDAAYAIAHGTSGTLVRPELALGQQEAAGEPESRCRDGRLPTKDQWPLLPPPGGTNT